MSDKITQLEQQIQDMIEDENGMIDLLNKNREKLQKLSRELFTEKTGIYQGAHIEWKDVQGGKKGEVINIEIVGPYISFIEVALYKKDGDIGIKWEKIWPQEFNLIKVVI
jgi:hypothetical protein